MEACLSINQPPSTTTTLVLVGQLFLLPVFEHALNRLLPPPICWVYRSCSDRVRPSPFKRHLLLALLTDLDVGKLAKRRKSLLHFSIYPLPKGQPPPSLEESKQLPVINTRMILLTTLFFFILLSLLRYNCTTNMCVSLSI